MFPRSDAGSRIYELPQISMRSSHCPGQNILHAHVRIPVYRSFQLQFEYCHDVKDFTVVVLQDLEVFFFLFLPRANGDSLAFFLQREVLRREPAGRGLAALERQHGLPRRRSARHRRRPHRRRPFLAARLRGRRPRRRRAALSRPGRRRSV